LTAYAKELELNTGLFTECLDSETTKSLLQNDLKDAVSLGVRGTPTFIVNNKKIEGALNKDQWDKIILGEIGTTKLETGN